MKKAIVKKIMMTAALAVIAVVTFSLTAFAAETTEENIIKVSNVSTVRTPAFQDESGMKLYCIERTVKAPDANGVTYRLVGEYHNETLKNIFLRENIDRAILDQPLIQFAVWGGIEGQEVGRNFAQFHYDETELECYDALFASTMDTDITVSMLLWESVDGEHQKMISYEIITPVYEAPEEPTTEAPEVPEEPTEPTTEVPAEPEAPAEPSEPSEPIHVVEEAEVKEVEAESFVPNTDGEALVFAGIIIAMFLAVVAVVCVRRSTRKYRLG